MMDDFTTIYERERPAVFAYLLKCSEHWQTAEDLAHDTFVVAWQKRDEWHDEGVPYRHYLMRVARLLFILHYKKERRRRRIAPEVPRVAYETAADDGGIDALLDQIDNAMAYAMLAAALPKLRARPRRALILRYGLGLQELEAGRRMGIGREAYRACRRGAEERLRQILLGQEPVWTEKNAKRRAALAAARSAG